MLAKWFGSIDFGKWALNTSSGFVVTTAVIFIIDAFVPGHMTEYLFSDLTAGKIIVFGLAAIVSSSILGLMIDCIYHTVGRRYAAMFWGPLEWVKVWRYYLMDGIGLTQKDFEWMYAASSARLSDAEVEKDYLRFTEAAGSMAYTMMLLLGPATFMFLRLEYHSPFWMSMMVAAFIILGGYILLFTNAASLRKYEDRKTSVVMREIRKASVSFDVAAIVKQCENAGCSRRKFQPGRLVYSLGVLILSVIMLAASQFPVNHQLTEETQMANMNVIGTAENITAENKGVPTLDIVVNKGTGDTPGMVDQAKSIAVIIKELSHSNTGIELKDADPVAKNADLIKLLGIPDVMKPKWKLTAYLFNTSNVTDGDRVYVNVLLSFKGVPASDIFEGEWLFPIIVQSGGKDYILAQVHVKINPAAPAAGNGEEENAGKADSSAVTAKNDSKKA